MNQAIKVLVADDEESILEIMSRKIANAGYDVISARNGQDALQLAQEQHPDVVILDITMPKMDGWQVLKELRQHPTQKKWQPVVLVSALSEPHNIKRGFELEADHYITKPCSMDEILVAIRQMISLIPLRVS